MVITPDKSETNTSKNGGNSILTEGSKRKRKQCPREKQAYYCKEWREGNLLTASCIDCGGKGICSHGKSRFRCKECGGGKRKQCPRGRQPYCCKNCGGKGICSHGKQRSKCKVCKKAKEAAKNEGGVKDIKPDLVPTDDECEEKIKKEDSVLTDDEGANVIKKEVMTDDEGEKEIKKEVLTDDESEKNEHLNQLLTETDEANKRSSDDLNVIQEPGTKKKIKRTESTATIVSYALPSVPEDWINL